MQFFDGPWIGMFGLNVTTNAPRVCLILNINISPIIKKSSVDELQFMCSNQFTTPLKIENFVVLWMLIHFSKPSQYVRHVVERLTNEPQFSRDRFINKSNGIYGF